MKTTKPSSTVTSRGIFFIVLLAAILAVLFGKSFLPGYVHFSNDGPLGQQNTAWAQLPAAFMGTWGDVNGIGGFAGSSQPDWTWLICWVLGPVGREKFLPPLALFILGLGAWAFFRQLRLAPLAATLGAFAVALSSSNFASACWGVPSQQIAIGMDFFALALVVSNSPETPALVRWMRLALAGLVVGINVMEAADIGAIFSLFVAAFVMFKALAEPGSPRLLKLGRGVGQVAVIAVFAGFMAVQTIVSLVGTQITGIAGTAQDTETKAQHWNWATQWSEPKVETLSLVVPGLFGYRMDTPKDMMEFLQDSYRGGNYWGGVGRDPMLDAYLSGDKPGPMPQGFMRFTGGGIYVGILVALVALWAVAHSLRRRDDFFTESQKRFIWFWAVLLIVSLLLSWGRFAPFYALLYKLPYFSTIRNPTKFILLFAWAISILFAYGVHGLNRRYLENSAAKVISPPAQSKSWWSSASGFDRGWAWFSALAFVGSVLAWLIYASEKPNLVRYLQKVGFGDEEMAKQIATFSIGQAGWFIVFFALAAGLCLLIIAGGFSGKRARWGGFLLGFLLVVDLGRADLPYIIHWDYLQKYASNPIIDFLRDKPHEHRVAYGFPWPLSTPQQFELFDELYKIEWMQHHFPYYNVQSLDIVQMPRAPADLEAFNGMFRIGIKQDGSGQSVIAQETFPRVARLWELTDTRYLLGPAALLDLFNGQLDPGQHRFRIVQRFDVVPKPGIERPTRLEELTAVPSDNGSYALFEFTGALPRAKLYSNWQISTNDTTALQTLASSNFDPGQTVLVSRPLPTAPDPNATNENSGAVEFHSYAPTDIRFNTQAGTPTVLLLNDKYDPLWQVWVDGKPAGLLRCNFIMRGVYLTPGHHTVEFKFTFPHRWFYVSLTAIVVGLLLSGGLICWQRRTLSGSRNRL
ncbi:MAG: hypothetical protein WAO02_13835 [Verrucomicrobiia bacterium]